MEHWRFDPEIRAADQGNIWDLPGANICPACGHRHLPALRHVVALLPAAGAGRKWRRIDRDWTATSSRKTPNIIPTTMSASPTWPIRPSSTSASAIGSGRAAEAAGWMRLFDKLSVRAQGEVMSDLPDFPPPPEPVAEQTARPLHDPCLVPRSKKSAILVQWSTDDPGVACRGLAPFAPCFFRVQNRPRRPPDAAQRSGADATLRTRTGSARRFLLLALGLDRSKSIARPCICSAPAVWSTASASPTSIGNWKSSAPGRDTPPSLTPRSRRSSRKACSSAVVTRPSAAFRCGNRPKRTMMSRWMTATYGRSRACRRPKGPEIRACTAS
jgi:hypothetical protein